MKTRFLCVVALLFFVGSCKPAPEPAASASGPSRAAKRSPKRGKRGKNTRPSTRNQLLRSARSKLKNPVLHAAFAHKRSDVITSGRGRVVKVLSDDNKGSRHQRFILDVGSGQTVLVAHNIDLAPKAPVRVGTMVRFKGEYEYNPRGGVLHWTHHDPKKKHPDGWLEVNRKRYQ